MVTNIVTSLVIAGLGYWFFRKLCIGYLDLLKSEREKVVEDVEKLLSQVDSDILEKKRVAAEEREANLAEVSKVMMEKIESIKYEYQELTDHFFRSVDSDETLAIVAHAYAVVSSGNTPRSISESNLYDAVKKHNELGKGAIVHRLLPKSGLN